MGIVPMAVTVSQSVHYIAGRLALFTQNCHKTTGSTKPSIRFSREPNQNSPPEQRVALEDMELMLRNKGAVRELPTAAAKRGNIFLVPKKDGKIDLKRLNQFITSEHFKDGGNAHPIGPPQRGGLATKVHPKDAYFMIPMDQRVRRFLQLRVQGRHYQLTCFPFDLYCPPGSSGLRVFTKTLRPVMALLRELGVRLVIYIDDILAETQEVARDHTLALIYLLKNLGFLVHPENM